MGALQLPSMLSVSAMHDVLIVGYKSLVLMLNVGCLHILFKTSYPVRVPNILEDGRSVTEI